MLASRPRDREARPQSQSDRISLLSPPRLFVRIDPQADLANELVSEERIRWMEPPGAAVAEQPLQLALLEHPESAGEIQRAIDDAEGGFYGAMPRRPHVEEP